MNPDPTKRLAEPMPEHAPQTPTEREEQRDVLVIRLASWATPALGVVMLAIGLLGGYWLRPLLDHQPASTPSAASSVAPPATEAPRSSEAGGEADNSSQASELADRQQVLMEAVVSRTRHFIGNPDAPVTIIEFGDFQ